MFIKNLSHMQKNTLKYKKMKFTNNYKLCTRGCRDVCETSNEL